MNRSFFHPVEEKYLPTENKIVLSERNQKELYYSKHSYICYGVDGKPLATPEPVTYLQIKEQIKGVTPVYVYFDNTTLEEAFRQQDVDQRNKKVSKRKARKKLSTPPVEEPKVEAEEKQEGSQA